MERTCTQIFLKSREVISELLCSSEVGSNESCRQAVRVLYLKLFNEIDVMRQLPLFEVLTDTLCKPQDSQPTLLMLQVLVQSIQLKHGNRIGQSTVVHIVQVLNNLVMKNSEQVKQMPIEVRQLIAQALGLLYYFRNANILQIFQKSQTDIQTAKSIFTTGLYQISQEPSCKVLLAFFELILQKPNKIKTQSDLDTTKILNLKQSSSVVIFSEEGHSQKAKMLIKPLAKHTLKSIDNLESGQSKQSIGMVLQLMSLMVQLIQVSKTDFKINLTQRMQQHIKTVINSSLKPLELYSVAKFVCLSEDSAELRKLIQNQNKDQSPAYKFDLSDQVRTNFVLKECDVDLQSFTSTVSEVYDYRNKGYVEQIPHNMNILLRFCDQGAQIDLQSAQNLFALRQFRPAAQTKQSAEGSALFTTLCKNLGMNSRDLRIQSLRILNDNFSTLDYLPFEQEKARSDLTNEIVQEHYSGPCPLLDKLRQYEALEVGFETMKSKETLLRSIQVMLSSGLVPEVYVLAAYSMMVGCLQIKFSPVHEGAIEVLAQIFKLNPERYLDKHLDLVNQISFLVQIPDEEGNESLEQALQGCVNYSLLQGDKDNQDILEILFMHDCVATQEYMMLKDFHYNLCKAMFTVVDLVLGSKTLSKSLFDQYRLFFNQEYLVLNQGRQTKSSVSQIGFQEQMIQANLVDTDQFRQKRKVCYSKLCVMLELFSKANHLSRLSAKYSEEFVGHLMLLLTTADSNLQKIVLSCLLKCSKKQDFDNKTLKLPKYRKLLEGLTDDTKFKDMIPVINHGSDEGIEAGKAQTVEDDVETGKDTKKALKGAIPKLEKEDRLDVLPVIVKLLFSKLLKKKGSINKKNIHTRRNIVYAFLSGLEPATEFPIFFKELLEPLGLQDLLEEGVEIDLQEISSRLAKISFGQQLGFISSLDVIFKQLGSLLSCNDYLTKLAKILVLILSLAKRFTGNLKESEEQEQSDQLYRFVGKQSKMCARLGLKILRDLFNRFSHYPVFMQDLSQVFYDELVKDQLPFLKERYASERSQLVEILSIGWSSHSNCLVNYTRYKEVLPSALRMLQAPKVDQAVVQQLMQMIKNLVVTSLEKKDKRKQQMLKKMDIDSSEGEDQEMLDQQRTEFDRENARQVIREHLTDISSNLHKYWQSNEQQLKQAVSMKQPKKQQGQVGQQIREQTQLQQTLQDMTFILSELSEHIGQQQQSEAQSFIDMLLSLLGNKQILETASTNQQSKGIVTSRQTRSEELLMFGCQALTTLIGQVLSLGGSIQQKILDNVFMMLLYMESKRVRQSLTEKLMVALDGSGVMRKEYLQMIKDMCSLKKGMADVPLDYDKVLSAIKKITELDFTDEKQVQRLEINAFTYLTVHLLKNDEFSVRDFAQHAFSHILPALDMKVFRQCEVQIISYIKQNNDELVLKTVLAGFKSMISLATDKKMEQSVSYHLEPLLFNNQSDDFFSQILSMQMQHRSKALRKLQGLDQIPATPFRQAILPLVDFLIFNTKSHMQNKRNTIRYTKEQSSQLLEDALNVYVSYSKRLRWTECFKLIRKLLFKIEKVTRRAAEVSAQKEDINMEKIVTKCLCKVLDGLSQNTLIQLPDSVDLIAQRANETNTVGKKPLNEFSKLIEDMLAEKKEKEVEEKEDLEDSEGDSSEDEDLVQKEKPDTIMTDTSQTRDIQQKLVKKVLPLLQRHLQETQQKKDDKNAVLPIRGFVAQSIAKVIRKLPINSFKLHLHKLINAIVVKGLRSTDLATREKARKALLRVIGEVSPRFLELIINQMHDNLTRGYQLHVYLYTVHYILNHLTGQNAGSASPDDKITNTLEPGMITSSIIKTTSDLLLRELFGDLMEERMLDETKKKHIKESKARKAFPIFEVFTQYIDFTDSFLDLIAPVIKILEENPNFTRIQQCEDLLGKISSSLLKNPTLTGEQLLIFIYSIIERGIGMSLKTKINDEKVERDYGAKADEEFIPKTKEQLMLDSHGIQMHWIKTGQHVSNKKTQEVCGRVLANFGLLCLKKGLKQQGLILSGTEHEQRKSLTIEINHKTR